MLVIFLGAQIAGHLLGSHVGFLAGFGGRCLQALGQVLSLGSWQLIEAEDGVLGAEEAVAPGVVFQHLLPQLKLVRLLV